MSVGTGPWDLGQPGAPRPSAERNRSPAGLSDSASPADLRPKRAQARPTGPMKTTRMRGDDAFNAFSEPLLTAR